MELFQTTILKTKLNSYYEQEKKFMIQTIENGTSMANTSHN